ncbi:MAG: tripartite tricarboxylate transporter substrate binding protein [Polaromonas sp.]|uniref:Bug family tripartite tricarboxylate transporter substrate binding protein n=1 Tax=Polaromonas sp. TaxID=1869339 RepID=UPI0025E6355F|nr:tripartite tricarboxylate transporter substrate binding protein [Polaromonas sp.]MBI2726519.1 tripartite tricarboxylate transporter substrate binding protein [Polaromonas sp.]
MTKISNAARSAILFLTTLAISTVNVASAAEGYPVRPVRIVVPYATGGSADVLARQIGAGLQQTWGQAVVVDNRAGAAGNIGTMEVVRSPADGYTLLIQNPTMVSNLAVAGKLPYDPNRDLTPIMYLGETPLVVVAHPSANIGNLKELVAAAKAKPGSLSYGSCAIGSPQHFVMEIIKERTGIEATHVAYKGCAPALADVLGGQIPLAVVTANLVAPHVKSGKLKVVGVSTAKRYAQLPDSPSFEEQGLQSFDIANWNGLMGPAKLSADTVNKLSAAVRKVLADPAVIAGLAKAGVEVNPMPASALVNAIRVDTVRYSKIAKDANIKSE